MKDQIIRPRMGSDVYSCQLFYKHVTPPSQTASYLYDPGLTQNYYLFL